MFGFNRFAYDLTIRILPFFEEYFGIGFQLPKIDMVAVPDFGFSAMENWGLITFRLVFILSKLSHRMDQSRTKIKKKRKLNDDRPLFRLIHVGDINIIIIRILIWIKISGNIFVINIMRP